MLFCNLYQLYAIKNQLDKFISLFLADMEDTLSVKSNESLPTSDEFDFLSDKPSASKTPTLDFKIQLNELRDALSEVNLTNAALQHFR